MQLDLGVLRQELNAIQAQKIEVNERLRSFSERGRGFQGRPPFGGGPGRGGRPREGGSYGPEPGEPRTPRARIPDFPPGPHSAPHELPPRPRGSGLASRIEYPNGEAASGGGYQDSPREGPRGPREGPAMFSEPRPGRPRGSFPALRPPPSGFEGRGSFEGRGPPGLERPGFEQDRRYSEQDSRYAEHDRRHLEEGRRHSEQHRRHPDDDRHFPEPHDRRHSDGPHPGRGREGREGQAEAELWAPQAPASEALPKRLMSAVVVDGTALSRQQEQPGIAKRPREEETDPTARKRNKRMFGALLGTLQKFKEDSAASRFNKAEILKAEALKRAEARKRVIAQEARQHERQQVTVKRLREVNRKRLLNAETDCKKAEITAAQRALHEAALAAFLKTAAGPPLLWRPKHPSPETRALLERRQAELVEWQAAEAARLEEAKAGIRARTQRIVDDSRASIAAQLAARRAQQAEQAAQQKQQAQQAADAAAAAGRPQLASKVQPAEPAASEGPEQQPAAEQEGDEEEYVVDEGELMEEEMADAPEGGPPGGVGGPQDAATQTPAATQEGHTQDADDRFVGQRAGQHEDDEHMEEAPSAPQPRGPSSVVKKEEEEEAAGPAPASAGAAAAAAGPQEPAAAPADGDTPMEAAPEPAAGREAALAEQEAALATALEAERADLLGPPA